MAWKAVASFLDGLSVTAISRRLDNRKLQLELDTQRLFLLTTHYRSPDLQGASPEAYAEELARRGTALAFEGMRRAVADNLQTQLETLTAGLHAINPDSAAAARLSLPQEQGSGAGRPKRFGLGSLSHDAQPHEHTQGPPSPILDPPTPTFALDIAPSSIQHASAGRGVWLRGHAATGQIVALYPGVAYRPLHHRAIPGYPMVGRDNEFLLSRFDGVALDGKPWGLGAALERRWPPLPPHNLAEEALGCLEGVNNLAAGHLVNHPPAGTLPNVAVASFDWHTPGSQSHLRAYIPNIEYTSRPALQTLGSVPGLALVALRDIAEEELFLNYRLNPNLPNLPEWYTAVDADEDARRWN
uniref:SET domain-containing protein n=1 Tax=Auxenochlorella protothecoides TaxID=3075 RepID=A0A1D1ZP11_AUXPR